MSHFKKKASSCVKHTPSSWRLPWSSKVAVYNSVFCSLNNKALSCHSETKAPRDEHSSVTIWSHKKHPRGETQSRKDRTTLWGYTMMPLCNETVSRHERREKKTVTYRLNVNRKHYCDINHISYNLTLVSKCFLSSCDFRQMWDHHFQKSTVSSSLLFFFRSTSWPNPQSKNTHASTHALQTDLLSTHPHLHLFLYSTFLHIPLLCDPHLVFSYSLS